MCIESKSSGKVAEQAFHVRTNQYKNKGCGGLSKRSRGGSDGGRSRDSNSQDHLNDDFSKREDNFVYRGVGTSIKGGCRVTIVIHLNTILMSVGRVTM